MRTLVIVSSTLLAALSLAGCNTMNNTAGYANSTVGSGVKYGAKAVGTGVGYVAGAGAAVGHGVGTVFETSTGWVTGHPVTYHHNNRYHNNQVIYHNGHRYVLKNGHYVRIQ